MAAKKNFFGRVRIVFRRSSTWTKVLILVPLVICVVVALCLRVQLSEVKAETQALRHQAAQLEQENQQLEQNIAILNTIQGVRQFASEDLGLVDPNTTFFTPVPATDSTNPE